MEQEYNHLIEVHGSYEIKMIFGDIHSYTEIREGCSYLELTTELEELLQCIDPALELMNE